MGVGAAAVVLVVGLLMYFLRASDPVAKGAVPYKKFDYGAHMEQQKRDFNRNPSAPGSAQAVPPAAPSPAQAVPPAGPSAAQTVRPTVP